MVDICQIRLVGGWVTLLPPLSSSSFLLPLGLIDGSMLIMVVKRGEEVAMSSETHLAQKKEREKEADWLAE